MARFDAMNHLHTILVIVFLTGSVSAYSQQGTLFIKKGIKKKRSYVVGDSIGLRLEDRSRWGGYITGLKNDTIFLNGMPLEKKRVRQVLLKRKPKSRLPDAATMALIAAGSAMTSLGLAISDPDNKKEAIIAGPVIGFGPLLARHGLRETVRAVKRKKFRIGRKFQLLIADVPLAR